MSPITGLLPGRPTESLRPRLRRDRHDPVGRTSQIHRNPRTTCPERVERIAFATLRSPLASGPIDLEHPLTPREQEACQPGPVATGALDRPGASARRMRPGELERVAVALPARLDDRFQQKRAARGGDEGARVRMTVRVD